MIRKIEFLLVVIALTAVFYVRAGAEERGAVAEIEEKAGPVENVFSKGLTPHLDLIGICMFMAKDGNNGSAGGDCAFDSKLIMDVDLDKAGVDKKAQMYMSVEVRQGPGITDRRLGDLFGVNNIEGPNFTQISELWYQKNYKEGSYFKVGLMDGAADFGSYDSGGDFLNSGFGAIPNVPVPTFPNYGYGVEFNLALENRKQLRVGVLDGAATDGPSRPETAFDNAVYIAELMFSPVSNTSANKDDDSQATVRVGIFTRTGAPVDSFDGLDHKGNTGFYMTADIPLTAKMQSFLQYGNAPGDRNLFSQYIGAGVVFKNVSKARCDDTLGIGFDTGRQNSYNREAGLGSGESALEVYYKMQMSKTLTIMPDLQLLRKPGGTGKNNMVYGLKAEYAY